MQVTSSLERRHAPMITAMCLIGRSTPAGAEGSAGAIGCRWCVDARRSTLFLF